MAGVFLTNHGDQLPWIKISEQGRELTTNNRTQATKIGQERSRDYPIPTPPEITLVLRIYSYIEMNWLYLHDVCNNAYTPAVKGKK